MATEIQGWPNLCEFWYERGHRNKKDGRSSPPTGKTTENQRNTN